MSFIFGGDSGLTYEQAQQKRRIAEALMQGMNRAPQNVGEGLNAIGQALAIRGMNKKADKADTEGRQKADSVFSALLGGSAVPKALPASTGGSGTNYRDAIASIESAGSGDYSAVGPTHPKLGRALGRYQVMEANIPQWSQAALGRSVTPDEFLANPKIQDAIFDHQFNGYVEKFGPEGAAQAWFAGPGGVGKMDRKDSLGTSVADYSQKFNRALGGGQQPVQVAGDGPGIEQIMAAMSNPYMRPEQKQALGIMLEQKMQSSDPMRQMQLEKGQLELNALRNPQPKDRPTVKAADGYLYYTDGEKERVFPNVVASGKDSDPMRQIQIEKGQLELDALRNPPPKDRPTVKAADGYLYYTDGNKERVFPDVVASGKDSNTEYGLNPQYVTDKAGNLGMVVLGKDGTAKTVELPEGLALQKGVEKLDLGTEYQWYNTVTGEPIGWPIPKNNRDAARDTAMGTAEGKLAADAAASAPTAIAQAQDAIGLIDSIINDPALPSITGMAQGRLPPITQPGTDLNVKIEQLQGKAFLEAFEALKGGGAITEREGQAAQNAMARLQRAQSDGAYREALSELRGIMQRALGTAQGRLGGNAQQQPAQQQPAQQQPAQQQPAQQQPAQGDFEAFAADPSARAAAERYGVTLEEMWAIKQGQR